MTSLTKKTTSGLYWSALERIGTQGIGFVIQILLARLIDPTEFGLLALLTIFIVFAQMIVDSGFSQALIQCKEVTRTDISTVFYINCLLSLIMYAVIYFSAPAIANFYEEPRLTILVRVLGINLLINAVGKIQNSMLVRGLQFRKLLYITLPAIIVSGIIGVVCALLNFEVWAIVAYQISGAVISNAFYWLNSDRAMWPRLEFSLTSVRNLGRFGIGVLGGSMLYQGSRNIYGLLIGKFFSFDQLAFYNRAQSFHQLPATSLSQILRRVLFPVFSTIQNDSERILQAIRRGIPIVAFSIFPIMAFLMCAPEEIIEVLLTQKWLPAAPFMRWFPILGMIYPIASIQLSVINAKGRSDLNFWMDLGKNAVSLTVLMFTLPLGVLEVVIGQVSVAMFVMVAINMPACAFVYGYRMRHQLVDIGAYLLCSAAGAIAALGAGLLLPNTGAFMGLTIKFFIFVVVYLFVCRLFNLTGLKMATEQFTQSLKLLRQRSSAFSTKEQVKA